MDDDIAIISIHGLPHGYTIAPEQLTPDMRIVMEEAIRAGKLPDDIWKAVLRVAPKFTIIPATI